MRFSNNVSYMLKILTYYIIMTRILTISWKGLLNCAISFQWYMILMRIGNQKATINNKVRAVEQKFILDPVM